MLSKMRDPKKGGSRPSIVFNGSPLFTGDAGGGESEIRRWIIESDVVFAGLDSQSMAKGFREEPVAMLSENSSKAL